MFRFFFTCAMYSIRHEIHLFFQSVKSGAFFTGIKGSISQVFNYIKSNYPELVKFVRKLLPPDFSFTELFASPKAFFESIASIPRYWFDFFNKEFKPQPVALLAV